jgi:cystathionine beta-lyase/cystathionine gamma-synthase
MWIRSKRFLVLSEHPDTVAVHAGRLEIPANTASSPPLFQASSYEFADLADVEAIYQGERRGAIYGRYGGPNTAQFERAIAELEGAEAAVGAAAGVAAINAALATNLRAGDTVLAGRELYGGTYSLLENDYRTRGVDVAYVDQQDLRAVAAALQQARPKVLYLEALTNPLMRVPDLAALAQVAHSVGKYIGGHGDVGAGVLAGRAGLVGRARALLVRTGAMLPHFEAWLALRGLRTLALRMARHSSNAVAVASFLASSPHVRRVHHPSRPSHPEHELAKRLYSRGTGGIVAFDLTDARAVDPFLHGLERIAIVHSLGEVATTISYPAVGSHRSLPQEQRLSLGVSDATLRISVGIEDPEDIRRDLAGALAGLDAERSA